ncbi:uncharacterized protein RAG0_15048 [Rhynchosporium agropyri]|uniref:Uncharacterized protein n=1 Tax=Rhynchosporium agropyri TaxID=914238 RepID=A0A1E1LJE3_9HELO|nr:uncharacterized protein RAG0_15048 [Rhynchosporium agropyri]
MYHHQECPARPEDSPTSLPRTRSNPDLNRLLRKSRGTHSQSQASSCRSEDKLSENSQVLYMADTKNPSRSRRGRQSLSSIGNTIERRFDGSVEGKENTLGSEKLCWDVIDQEIYEWQYVCATGRPYWWSPESRYTRLKRYPARLPNEPPPPKLWLRELDDLPKTAIAETRRAVSDNYFCSPAQKNHDLAHLVAVQLLGACFTLPPDHVLGIPTPSYTFDPASAMLPDPRMISSLRMHTQFKYSPSFGHQARNTSPIQAWPRAFTKSSPGFTSPVTGIRPSAPGSRRTERRRKLQLTDGSGCYGSVDSVIDQLARSCSSTDGLDPELKRCQSRESPRADQSQLGMPDSSSYEIRRLRRDVGGPSGSKETRDSSEQTLQRTNYRLEPVIRSEPHHVFIQPVRELVVKRWRTFKRRMSGSLHSAFQSGGSEDHGSASEIGSPMMSSDGKARRRRAQERGDIHSSEIESAPHFTTPVSGCLTPNAGLVPPDQIDLIDKASSRFANQNIAEAVFIEAESKQSSPQPLSSSRSSSQVPPADSARPAAGLRTPSGGPMPNSSRSGFPLYSPARLKPPAASNSFSSKRLNKDRRKSTLSEMFTADDFLESQNEDLEVSSAPVTANVTPMEEKEQDFGHAASTSAIPTLRNHTAAVRPRFARTSTSGTQIFTPENDGIEVDGLPVGPSEQAWIGPEGRERTYL